MAQVSLNFGTFFDGLSRDDQDKRVNSLLSLASIKLMSLIEHKHWLSKDAECAARVLMNDIQSFINSPECKDCISLSGQQCKQCAQRHDFWWHLCRYIEQQPASNIDEYLECIVLTFEHNSFDLREMQCNPPVLNRSYK